MSRRGANWYKREPHAYLGGVRGLTERQHAVYSVVLELIYDGGGECPNDPKWISGWFSNIGPAAVRRTITELESLGKLSTEGDLLTNERAKNEAKTWEKLSENRSKTGKIGGVLSGVSRRTAKENNDLEEPSASTSHEADKIREEKKVKRVDESTPKKTPTLVLSLLLGSELAAAVVEHRQRLRKPMTVKAAELMLREFEKCTEPIAGAEMMIARGWQGFKAQWTENDATKQRTNGDGRLAHSETLLRVADGVDERTEAEGPVDYGAGAGDANLFLPARDHG